MDQEAGASTTGGPGRTNELGNSGASHLQERGKVSKMDQEIPQKMQTRYFKALETGITAAMTR